MFRYLLARGLLVTLAVYTSEAAGHGTPINAFVVDGNQIGVATGIAAETLEDFGGFVFTDQPGIGINSTGNGFVSGDDIYLNVLQGLLYWDGTQLAETDETLLIEEPGGLLGAQEYAVTVESGYQSGLRWGTYQPGRSQGDWEAHGVYSLESPTPAAGLYGLVLQLSSPGKVSSEPFLLPLNYRLGALQVNQGITAFMESIAPLPSADFDRNTGVDATDLAIWRAGFGATTGAFQVEGDANADGAIDGADFLAWQRQAVTSSSSSVLSSTVAVPEPSAGCLLAMAAVILVFNRR